MIDSKRFFAACYFLLELGQYLTHRTTVFRTQANWSDPFALRLHGGMGIVG